MISELGLTKAQYGILNNILRKSSPVALPCYRSLKSTRFSCYPAEGSVTVTDRSASVRLQSMIDHLATRLVMLSKVDTTDTRNLELILKWGCDGSGGHDEFKYKTATEIEEEEKQTEGFDSVFNVFTVPLVLRDASSQLEIWKNERPSSSSWCSPISFEYMKENEENVMRVVNKMKMDIKKLEPTTFRNITVTPILKMTMVDGKICNIVTGNRSTQTCYLCKKRPSKTSDDVVNNPVEVIDKDFLEHGISPLHCRIRCMEHLLQIAYKLPFGGDYKKSTMEGEYKEIKQKIQAQFREKLGIKVDMPRQGFGTTNDGNTARNFFKNYQQTAEITGLNEHILRRFAVILQVINSSRRINHEKFKLYTKNTKDDYIELYSKILAMTPTVHKLLDHAQELAEHAIVPIGSLSEEAQEARNKDFKYFRSHHSRKCSMKASNQDVFNRLLLTADPFLSSLRTVLNKVVDIDELSEESDSLLCE